MIRTYKRKLKLTASQENRLRSWIGACRVVYNLGLEIRIDTYKKTNKSVHKFDLIKQLPALRADISWMSDVPAWSLQNAIDRLDKSYKNFFQGGGFPKWASKKTYKSIIFGKDIGIKENSIKIPKLGLAKLVNDAPIIGNIRTISIKIEPTGIFAFICCNDVPENKHTNDNSIGVDMGLVNFAIGSNGIIIQNPKHFKKYELKLRIENRSLARKVKFSKSWHRQAKKLSLLHHKIGSVRKDFLHKQSTLIAKANNVVYMEALNVKGMTKNTKLSKHILDAGWATFRAMLAYKTNVIAIDPKFTSQTCFECKEVDKLSRLSQSEFVCTSCGHIANADINAAKNIKYQGMILERKREALACA